MQQSKPWHEDDTFWETWGPIMFSEKRLADAPKEIESIISLLNIKPRAHVLDLGCGVGRHSLELARRGFHVTGVDRTASYLDRAAKQAVKEELRVEFVQEDMRKFCRPTAFDAAINMNTSFSYFEDPEEDRQVITNVYRSLKSGGVFVLDTMGKEILARVFKDKDWSQEGEVFVLQERRVSHDWSWMENRWIIFQDGKRTESKVTHRLYSATELAALFANSGFKGINIYGDLSGSAYDHMARRLVMVGKK